MSRVNYDKLQKCFDSLWAYIADAQAGQDETISFRHGLIAKQEGFKYILLEKAQVILHNVPWEEPNIIGSGKIFQAAQALLTSCPHTGPSKQQILVDFRDVESLYENYSDSQIAQIEAALYILYTDSNDERAFNMLSDTLSKGKYAIISYFFFLKDSSKYQVMRPNNFSERFSLLGISAKCTRSCNWQNYQEYLAVLREIQLFLNDRLFEEVSLTDAHSFVWMLWNIKDSNIANQTVKIDENCNVVYTSAKEGRKILYYTNKYERKPELRAEAIRIHGYTCAVCGFNFEEQYGSLGKEYIEVHHVKPLSSLEEEIEIYPDKDMVCLCANCHRMIHRKKNAILTVSDLKKIRSENKVDD